MKNQLTGKDPTAGKDWGEEEMGLTENETIRWSITNSLYMSLSKLREIVKDSKA